MSFLVALQFLTSIPVPVKRPFSAGEMGRAAGWFPLVGVVIGLILTGLDGALRWAFPPPVAAALVLVAWVGLTGALHLDGFIDCCDGLLVEKPPQKRLEVLRDTRVGAFGVVGAVCLLALKFAALAGLPAPIRWPTLLVVPTLSRWSMAYALARYPYARPEGGCGAPFRAGLGWRQGVLSTLTALLVAMVALQWVGLAALVAAWLIAALVARWTMSRIPGLTGDVYGALNEIVEVSLLLLATGCGGKLG